MTLRDCKPGQSARVLSVGGEGALRQHFLDMGVIPGAELTVVKLAPMGDPMELRIHGYELTLRLADAEKIQIAPLESPSASAAPARPQTKAERQKAELSPRPGRGGQVPSQGHGRSPAGE